MATGNDVLTQTVIELGTLRVLPAVARKAKSSSIVKECCWLISNVIAGESGEGADALGVSCPGMVREWKLIRPKQAGFFLRSGRKLWVSTRCLIIESTIGFKTCNN